MKILRSIWQGDLPLFLMVWCYGPAWGDLLTNYIPNIILIPMSRLSGSVAPGYVYAALILPPSVIWHVGLWRSAGRYNGRRVWSALTRVAVVIQALVFLASQVYEVYSGGPQRH